MSGGPKRILVVQPTWVGDAVMATPCLRAVRLACPQAHITYLVKRYVKAIFCGMPWADRILSFRPKRDGVIAVASRVRAGRFDTAILLTNSFRSALISKLGGVRRIIGYDRDGRKLLLTERLAPPRQRGRLVPSPIIWYYLALARRVGYGGDDIRMELFVTPRESAGARSVLERAGLDAGIFRPGRDGKPLVLLNPGANYGSSKIWLPERFAAVADRLIETRGATVLVSGAPKERRVLDEVLAHMKRPAIDLSRLGLTLGALKDIVRRCDLMLTNDTGPRHIAAAFGVPVVTIFGPTHPQWTEIYYDKERQVQIPVDCGPCQLKVCPLDHRCMTGISVDMVLNKCDDLLSLQGESL